MSTKRRGAYSPGIRMPGSSIQRSGRGGFGLLLCLLLPPVGLMFLWRKGVFRVRGRVTVTALATIEMAVLLLLLTPPATVDPTLPLPGVAQRYTPAPEGEVLTALSNMDQLLRQQQAADGDDFATVEPVDQAKQLAEQQAILQTIVYVYNGAGTRYYHTGTVCGNQSNLLSMTVEEALAEKLGPCPDCNPPTFSALHALPST